MSAKIALPSLQPILSGVKTAGDAIGLKAHELLHAGPPLNDPQNPPPVLMSAAVMTAMHEGWANSPDAAEKLVRDGAIQWRCAQDHQCVAPLAATISQNTPLFEVTDPDHAYLPRYSIVSPVRGADTRMGNRDSELLTRLKIRDDSIGPAWQHWLSAHGPLPLWPIAHSSLTDGDDLHYSTSSASRVLGAALACSESGQWIVAVSDTPTYFLTLWMATCAMLLDATSKGPSNTAITKVGGNGEAFGISIARSGAPWVSGSASPPIGVRMPGAEYTAACPAIGDSAVIDIAGFGAQCLQFARPAREAFAEAGVLPADYAGIAAKIGIGELADLGQARPSGVDAQKVVSEDTTPLIALAILDAAGQRGLLGRGLYRTERSLFEQAIMG